MNIDWIKLDINILDDSKIKLIRKYPDGNSLIVLWIGLLCLAMKSEKVALIEVSSGIPYTAEDISTVLDIELNTVKLGLSAFEKMKMIEIINNNTIFIINFEKHQSLEKIKNAREQTRLRVTKFRALKKTECNALHGVTDSVTCNAVTKCNATDIDTDIQIQKKNNIYISPEQFYKKEIESLPNDEKSNDYKKLVDFLFGKNELKVPLKNVLSIKNQITFENFIELLKVKPEGTRIGQILLKIENDSKYYKGKKNLHITLKNWLTNRFVK